MDVREWTKQSDAAVRFDWGPAGVEAIAADHVVVVDVLRFTTAVEAATTAGALVFPYRWKDATAAAYAERLGAALAGSSDPSGPTLSPVRLSKLGREDRVVLPSPNGSTCAAIAAERGAVVVAACLRNYSAVAAWLNRAGGSVAVIACGERWLDGSLRPSLEDLLGAAALVAALDGRRSAEADVLATTWAATAGRAADLIRDCASGRELTARGWQDDLDYACELDVSATVPVLVDGAFAAAAR